MHDYSNWWSRRTNGLSLTAEFTCLLIRVCACSVPYIEEGLRQKLESQLGGNLDHLSVRYHNTAKQLSSTIGPGRGGMTQLQQLFLTAQWYKTEALFVESWHALSVAIHEAQEQGIPLWGPSCTRLAKILSQACIRILREASSRTLTER
jgi:hypothetical protein